jgi:hypothetical protein
LVITMLDRAPGQYATSVRFLGREAKVPAAAFLLAASTGASILSAVTFRNESGRRVLALGTAQGATDPADADACAAAMQHAADEVTALIRAAPSQWHVPAHADQLPWLADSWVRHHRRRSSAGSPRDALSLKSQQSGLAGRLDDRQ